MFTLSRFELLTALALTAVALTGCTPELGDKCVLSTDCSLRGDRTCDTSQPGGYCTIRDCRANTCPDDGACVLFEPAIPGCGFDDRSPSRVGRAYCMAACESDSDCRGGDYICANPKESPWFAVVLDDNTTKRVCVIRPSTPDAGMSRAPDAPVCSPISPDAGTIEAGSFYDGGGSSDADIADATLSDAGTDAPSDASGAVDANDAGPFDAAEGG